MAPEDLFALAPLAWLAGGAALILLLSVARGFWRPPLPHATHTAAFALLAIGTASAWISAGGPGEAVARQGLYLDGMTAVLGGGVLIAAALCVPVLMACGGSGRGVRAECQALLLLALVGMLLMVMAANLMLMWMGLVLMALAVVTMSGLQACGARALESTYKAYAGYLLALACMAFGMAQIYAEVGLLRGEPSLDLMAVGQALTGAPLSARGGFGIALVFAGLAHGSGLVPFAMGGPDVLVGASAGVAAVWAGPARLAALAAMYRVTWMASAAHGAALRAVGVPALQVVALACLAWGAILAPRQVGLRRVLAHIATAQAGLYALGLAALLMQPLATTALWLAVALVGDAIAGVGALAAVAALEGWVAQAGAGHRAVTHADLLGLGHTAPGVAMALGASLLQFAALPLAPGAFVRMALLAAVCAAGPWWLALAGALGLVSGAACALRLVLTMVSRPPSLSPAPAICGPWLRGAQVACAGLTLAGGVWPGAAVGLAGRVLLLWQG